MVHELLLSWLYVDSSELSTYRVEWLDTVKTETVLATQFYYQILWLLMRKKINLCHESETAWSMTIPMLSSSFMLRGVLFLSFLKILRNEIYNFSASIELNSTSKQWNKRLQCSLAWGDNLYSFVKFLTTSGRYVDHLQKHSFIPLNDGGSFYKHLKRSAIGQL